MPELVRRLTWNTSHAELARRSFNERFWYPDGGYLYDVVDAWLRAHPRDREAARRMLGASPAHLAEACIGSISDIFDAEPPFAARGCIAQAWNVAEVLRAWIKTARRS